MLQEWQQSKEEHATLKKRGCRKPKRSNEDFVFDDATVESAGNKLPLFGGRRKKGRVMSEDSFSTTDNEDDPSY